MKFGSLSVAVGAARTPGPGLPPYRSPDELGPSGVQTLPFAVIERQRREALRRIPARFMPGAGDRQTSIPTAVLSQVQIPEPVQIFLDRFFPPGRAVMLPFATPIPVGETPGERLRRLIEETEEPLPVTPELTPEERAEIEGRLPADFVVGPVEGSFEPRSLQPLLDREPVFGNAKQFKNQVPPDIPILSDVIRVVGEDRPQYIPLPYYSDGAWWLRWEFNF